MTDKTIDAEARRGRAAWTRPTLASLPIRETAAEPLSVPTEGPFPIDIQAPS